MCVGEVYAALALLADAERPEFIKSGVCSTMLEDNGGTYIMVDIHENISLMTEAIELKKRRLSPSIFNLPTRECLSNTHW